MPSRVFDVDELEAYDLFEGSADVLFYEGSGANRWSEVFEIVFTADDGKNYHVLVEEGLTENQDYYGAERFPECTSDGGVWYVECPEVETYQVVQPVTKWRAL